MEQTFWGVTQIKVFLVFFFLLLGERGYGKLCLNKVQVVPPTPFRANKIYILQANKKPTAKQPQ